MQHQLIKCLSADWRSLFGREPDQATIATAAVSTTDCRGMDLDMMLNPEKGKFAIGARLPNTALVVDCTVHRQVVWLDNPDTVVRTWDR